MPRRWRACALYSLLALPFLILFISYKIDPYGVEDLFVTIYMKTFDSTVTDFLTVVNKLKMNDTERSSLLDIAQRFDRIAIASGLQYHVSGGVLIGFVRHGNLVPWDDDFDVLIPRCQRRKLEVVFRAMAPGYGLQLVKRSDDNFKVTFRGSARVWPYIDVFIYNEFPDYIEIPNYRMYTYSKASIFPLERVDFAGIRLNFPRCPWSLVMRDYGSSILKRCCTGKWNHREETLAPLPRCVSCTLLQRNFPFAHVEKVNKSAVRLVTTGGERRVYRVGLCDVEL